MLIPEALLQENAKLQQQLKMVECSCPTRHSSPFIVTLAGSSVYSHLTEVVTEARV